MIADVRVKLDQSRKGVAEKMCL